MRVRIEVSGAFTDLIKVRGGDAHGVFAGDELNLQAQFVKSLGDQGNWVLST